MRPSTSIRLAALLILIPAPVFADDTEAFPKRYWNFLGDPPGVIAGGFTAESGRWEVVDDDGKHVLAQRARSEDAAFNVALVNGPNFQCVDLSVRMRAVEGDLDQGGGLVWRARDARNYYLARYNPLESNFRVYKVEKGVRTLLRGAAVAGDRQWHTLKVVMKNSRIYCHFDGKQILELVDSTFPDGGKVGLWTKSDARSYFADFLIND